QVVTLRAHPPTVELLPEGYRGETTGYDETSGAALLVGADAVTRVSFATPDDAWGSVTGDTASIFSTPPGLLRSPAAPLARAVSGGEGVGAAGGRGARRPSARPGGRPAGADDPGPAVARVGSLAGGRSRG